MRGERWGQVNDITCHSHPLPTPSHPPLTPSHPPLTPSHPPLTPLPPSSHTPPTLLPPPSHPPLTPLPPSSHSLPTWIVAKHEDPISCRGGKCAVYPRPLIIGHGAGPGTRRRERPLCWMCGTTQDDSVDEDELNSSGGTWDGHGLCVYVCVWVGVLVVHMHVSMCMCLS